MDNEKGLLYDYERDGDIKLGEAILVFENGKTKRVRASSLYEKEKIDVREPVGIKKANLVRSRPPRTAKHRQAPARRAPQNKRLPVYKA